jgi:hypothetical protein
VLDSTFGHSIHGPWLLLLLVDGAKSLLDADDDKASSSSFPQSFINLAPIEKKEMFDYDGIYNGIDHRSYDGHASCEIFETFARCHLYCHRR